MTDIAALAKALEFAATMFHLDTDHAEVCSRHYHGGDRRLARKMGVTLVTTPSGWIGYADCVTAREE